MKAREIKASRIVFDALNVLLALLNDPIAERREVYRLKELPDRYEIEVVDLLRESKRALNEGVLPTPMLVKCSPAPIRKVIGNLSEQKPLLQMLELPA